MGVSSPSTERHLIDNELSVPNAKSWGVVPDEPVAIYIDDTKHYPVSGPHASAQWRSLLPSRGHLMSLPHPTSSSPPGNDEPHTVAMFHQLECLDTIRQSFLSKNISTSTRRCFNYLHQAVLCHSDRRLESIRWIGKPHLISVAGYWQCRDWEAVYRAAERHKAD
jgi:hypothetical protein